MPIVRIAMLLSLFAAPALAGGFSFDLPHLTWPVETTVASTSGAPAPAPVPAK